MHWALGCPASPFPSRSRSLPINPLHHAPRSLYLTWWSHLSPSLSLPLTPYQSLASPPVAPETLFSQEISLDGLI